jgi:signal peptidase I
LSYCFDEPERGEIVLYRSQNGDINQIRRIIGLPGDIIEVHDKSVFINGIRLSEPYVKYFPTYTLPAYQVPTNYFFVLSDNRNTSEDSESDWTVSRENVTGRAWLFTWPPEKWGIIANYPLSQQLTAAQSP